MGKIFLPIIAQDIGKVTQVLGASSFRDLKTIVLDSLATSCSMVFQSSCSISGLLEVSKLLLVIIQQLGFEVFATELSQIHLARNT